MRPLVLTLRLQSPCLSISFVFPLSSVMADSMEVDTRGSKRGHDEEQELLRQKQEERKAGGTYSQTVLGSI